jgi:hypothetical protein
VHEIRTILGNVAALSKQAIHRFVPRACSSPQSADHWPRPREASNRPPPEPEVPSHPLPKSRRGRSLPGQDRYLRTIFRAIATSAPVGRTVIGNLDPWRRRLDLIAVRMARRIGRVKPSNAPPTPPVRRSSGPQRGETIRGSGLSARILSGTLLPRSRLEFVGGVPGHGN